MSTETAAAIDLSQATPIKDGMRVRMASSSPQPTFLMINGLAHLLEPDVARHNLFGNADSTPIKHLVVSIGGAIGFGYLAREENSKPVYLVYDNYKRWIPSPEVFKQFGFDWNLVRVLPAGALKDIPKGPDVG